MARGDDVMCHSTGDPTTATCDGGAKAGARSSSVQLGASPVQIDEFLAAAASAPADCGVPVELPPWFDWDKFRRGQQYFRRHVFALFVAKLSGLLCVLAVPSILRVLCFTRQSGEPCSAFRRYVATLAHMLDWYDGDLLEPASRAYQSLSQVRAKHAAAAKRSRKAGLGLMSQLDMVLTQFGFMGFAMVSPERVGVANSSEQELEGFLHFWRTVGYLLGIEDRFNLCRDSVAESKALCRAVQERGIRPAMEHPPANFDTMARALVSGMKCMVPQLDYEAFVRHINQELLGIEGLPKMSMWSRFNLWLQKFVTKWLLGVTALACVFRPFFNGNLRLAIWITQRCPFLAYWRFGKAQVHQYN